MNAVGLSAPAAAKRGTRFPRAVIVVVCVAGLLALNGRQASADPIRNVTSGIIYMLAQDNETGFAFRGATFDIEGGGVDLHPVNSPCGPCAAGSLVSLGATLTPNLEPGSATLDGHAYDNVYFGGTFNVIAGLVTVPNVAPTAGYIYENTWFRFTGSLAGYSDRSRTGTPLFSTRLAGSGTASQGFFNDGSVVSTDAFKYEFANAAPTPEPGTFLLFAPGAAWVMRQIRRRRYAFA